MHGQIATITKEQVAGHCMQIASQSTVNGCKIMTYMIGVGYGVSYSKNNGEEGEFGTTDSMDMAIASYNSVQL